MNDKFLTVSDINNYVKNLLEQDNILKRIYLKGEISNYKGIHASGHLYFSLKDENSRIKAVMWKTNVYKLNFPLKEGMSVIVEGKLSVYPPTGEYQINIEKMTEDGLGNLYIKFEELKQSLAKEGLFSEENKKSLPKFPTKIGIITAKTGAAVKDIMSTIKRRYPICETILFPTLVQGEGAKESISKQIKKANEYDLDLIILGRGGGSIEDLWAFNEEIVARSVFESKIPIISAVGHDIDYTICDFVADLRAPTPTGGAEMAVPDIKDIINHIKQLEIRCNNSILSKINELYNKLNSIKNSYILKNPLALYDVRSQKISYYMDTLNNVIHKLIENYRNKFAILNSKIILLNPLNILEKGYSVVTKNGKIIKDSESLRIGEELNIRLHRGAINTIIKEVQ